MYRRVLIITKCEVASQSLDAEIKSEVNKEEEQAIVLKPKDEDVVMSKPANAPPVVLKPKQDVKSASQIVNEQRGK